ncbi:MAG: hypothetical protein LKJ45_06015 [Oscillospiraceae bacterium]|jgi:hypothetical protein|nr:hypothetical protein [Oscillospiraceae bacterium]
MMWNRRRGCNRCWPRYAIAFGIGLICSCFCPTGLMLFIVAVIMVALGIALLKKC